MDEPTYRLKIKIGANEFEADGPASVVTEQFQTFKELLTSAAIVGAVLPALLEPDTGAALVAAARATPAENPESSLEKILTVEGRVISLTARPKSIDDAALLLLFGQKVLRQNDAVTGSELVDGLTKTGGLAIGRVDRVMDRAAIAGDAIVIGERRAKRYRLTNTGIAKARTLASDLIATVA